VLTIGKLGGSSDQLVYYEQQVAQGLEDYFSGRGEAPGRWIGGGCGGMGVSGQVDRDGFMRAMAGCDPRTGAALRPPRSRAKVAAFDLTFSAPKSVSVLFAVADQETSAALLEAHERAVEAAFAYVEREACFTRRGHAGMLRVRGDGFVAAAYRHRLSRAGDPQLHTHVVVANMTRAEGRWTTLEAHSLYEHALAAGALYRAVLRAEVRERLPWVWWREVSRGLFEIEGVPDGVLREFSRRRLEIEERARELTGVAASSLSRERLQGIALATRKAKEYGVDGARWRKEARARAEEHGFSRRELERLVAAGPRVPGASATNVARALAPRLSGREGLTAQHNTFARRHALTEIAGGFTQGAGVREIERATSDYLEHSSVVPLGGGDGEARFTTLDLLACERAIIAGAARRVEERAGLVHPRLPDLVLADYLAPLSAEQATAARELATDGRGVSVLQALAGTGKTRVLAALARIYETAGYQVIGVAPTGRAARELADAADIEASTIHRRISELEQDGGLRARTVVLFDEAGMAPTRLSAELFSHAEQAGAKVIVAGDAGQLPSVAAGGWFAAVAETLGGPELREVMRQRDPNEREALEALHEGDPDSYLAFKQRQGQLHVHAQQDAAVTALIGQWDRACEAHGVAGAAMISRDNATRARLNELARARLKQDRMLGADGAMIGGCEFCVGDRVIARRNDRCRDVDNGTRATVIAVDHVSGALTVETDASGRRVLDATYVADHLEHAYALTGHGVQGATVEWAGVIGRPCEFTAEWAYTALARAREHTQLHVMAEPRAGRRERVQFAPPEPDLTFEEALNATRLAMRRRESERLAIRQVEPQELRTCAELAMLRLPLAEIAEAGVERTATSRPLTAHADEQSRPPPLEPGWRALRRQRDALGRGLTIGR
jgi:conjugative relaxase-like TrwC/TraI family protein